MVISVFAGTLIDTSVFSVVVYDFVLLASTLKEDLPVTSVEKALFVPEPKNPAPTSRDNPIFTARENPAPILKLDEVDTAAVSHLVHLYGFAWAEQMTGRKPLTGWGLATLSGDLSSMSNLKALSSNMLVRSEIASHLYVLLDGDLSIEFIEQRLSCPDVSLTFITRSGFSTHESPLYAPILQHLNSSKQYNLLHELLYNPAM